MRLIITLLLFAIISCVTSKNNVKALTESMGQEVIEIGTPIKELPPDLEEEPSAENYEESKTTITTQPAGTKRDFKKSGTASTLDTRRKMDKTTSKEDDEEARIEKELAEIYKDNLDYKSDSSEVMKEVTPVKIDADKPILRSKPRNFKFQPDLDNKAEVERFRTSIDEISCDKNRMKGADSTATPYPGSATSISAYFLISFISLISAFILNY